MASTQPDEGDTPISLEGTTARELGSPQQLADRLVAAWFAARQRPYVQTGMAFASTIGARAEGEPSIEMRIGLTPRPVGIVFSGSAMVRYERSSWPAALATCNQWNGTVPLPTARLAVASWDEDQDAPVVLEAWMPLTPNTEQAAVDIVGDSFVRGAVSFWRPAPAAT